MLLTSLAFLILIVASIGLPSPKSLEGRVAPAGDLVSTYWLIGTYFMLTIAELFLSPMGISLFSKGGAAQVQGIDAGGWFAATAVGNYLVTVIGYFWLRVPLWSLWLILVVCCLLSAAFMFGIMKKAGSGPPRHKDKGYACNQESDTGPAFPLFVCLSPESAGR